MYLTYLVQFISLCVHGLTEIARNIFVCIFAIWDALLNTQRAVLVFKV